MFKKQRVSFKRKDIFGQKFSPNIESCFCAVSKLLFADLLNIDGSIDIEKATLLKKEQLWSYIYYLYHFNHENDKTPEFIEMTNKENGKSNATKFYDMVITIVESDEKYKTIKPAPAFDENTLIYFINIIVHKYEGALINPVIDYLNKILSKEIIPSLGSLSIKTGESSGKNVTIVTEPKDVTNANVKVNFRLTRGGKKKMI